VETFQQARKHHLVVAEEARRNESDAAALWNAVTGAGSDDLPPRSYAEGVRDTLPQAEAPILASQAVAAAFAFALHASMAGARGEPISLRDTARRNWRAFVEQAHRVDAIAQGFGWDLSAAWQAQRETDLGEGSMLEVEKVAHLAGRMYASIRGENATRIAGVGGEIYSVEQGNNLGRLLPSELVQLLDELLEVTVLERIATRRAMQYAVRGTDRAARGPMVVLIDESGSMKEGRNRWAKAAALAIARVAKDERRPFVAVHFSTSQVVRRVDPQKPAEVLPMLSHFLNGGTHVGMAMAAGLDEVGKLEAEGKRGGDLLLITDGVDGDEGAQRKQAERAKEKNVRLWTIAIECSIDESSPLRSAAAGYMGLGGAELADGAGGAFLADAVR